MSAAPETAAPEQPLGADSAVFSARIAAAWLDIAVLIALFIAMAVLSHSAQAGGTGFSIALYNGPFLLYMLLVLAYFFVLEWRFGQTLGKRAAKVRVVRADGSPAGPGAILARTIFRLIDWLPLFYLLGFLVALATARRQRIGDHVARTVLVRA